MEEMPKVFKARRRALKLEVPFDYSAHCVGLTFVVLEVVPIYDTGTPRIVSLRITPP